MSNDRNTKTLDRLLDFASFGLPLLAFVATAASEPYWLDCPEFTAAVQTLGIPHPPGHPLYILLAKPFTLLPIGSIAFRVSLASAVFGALAALLLYRLLRTLVDVAGPSLPHWVRGLVAFSSVLLAVFAKGWWFQCVRQEVYSLQILLVLCYLYPLVTVALHPGKSNDHRFYLLAFFVGLGLTNHHYITIVALPAMIPVLVAEARHRGGAKAVWFSLRLGGVGATGLLPYLFLPIRSNAGALVSLGGVHSLSDFFWVVSAKVYQKSMLKEHTLDLSERSMDAVFSIMGELNPLVWVVAMAGFYFMIRIERTRLAGVVLALTAGVAVLLRAVMGFDPFNPDYWGYMLPVLVAIVAAFAFFITVAMEILRAQVRVGGAVAGVLSVALLTAPVLKARGVYAEVDLSRFDATRLVLDSSFEDAAPGSRVLTSNYKLFFVLSAARFIDGTRPDIRVINPKLLGYPGYLKAVLDEEPELRELARTMVIHGNLTESSVADLAWKGPLQIEADLWLPVEVTRYMLPRGPTYPTSAEPLSRDDVAAAAVEHFEKWAKLYHLLGPDWQEHETWRLLSWSHYQDALFFARRGLHDEALKSIEMFKSLGNESAEMADLEKVLEPGQRRAVDIDPFLPGRVAEQ